MKWSFFIICLLGAVLYSTVSPSLAQTSTTWSAPQRIPGYENDTFTPVLLTGLDRSVYAFASQWSREENGPAKRVIIYNRWTPDQGWTKPIDIIMSPYKNDARILDAVLDRAGMIHVIFWGGDNIGANIYHTAAPITKAGNARAWSEPNLVADNAGDPDTGAGAVDAQGHIYLLYNGRNENGVYSTISEDGGITWTEPTIIYQTLDQNRMAQALHVYQSQAGQLYAVWNVITIGGQGRGIYFSKLQKGGSRWANPTLLAEAQSGYGTNTPAVIEYKGNIFAIYNMTPKITMRRSLDDGQTWSEADTLFNQQVGVSGNISLVIDCNDTLRLFFVQRIPGIIFGTNNPDIGGVWQSVWVNGYWIEPEPVTIRPSNSDATGNDLFAPYETRAVITTDNNILITWMTDPGIVERNGIWYSYININSQNITAISQPIPTTAPYRSQNDNPAPTANYSLTLSNSDSISSQISISKAYPIFSNEPSSSLFQYLYTSIALVILIIVAIIFYILIIRKR